MKILIVDEEKAAISYYKDQLEDEGMDVCHCRKTDDALKEIRKDSAKFDLVILDSAMPPGKEYANANTDSGNSTGAFLFKDIRKSFPKTPILILTNFGSLDWIREAIKFEFVRTFRKIDVTPTQLVKIVYQMVKDAR